MRSSEWEFHQSTVSNVADYGGKSEIIFWEQEYGEMYRLAQSVRHLNHAAQNWLRGKPNWGKRGVVVSQMRKLPATLYLGDRYDCNCCAIVPNDETILPALWAYCSSPEYNLEVRKLSQKLNVTPGTLLDVPFDLDRWTKLANQRYPNGLPRPYSDDPTQWIFHGHPCGSVIWEEEVKWTAHGPHRTDATVLQVAVARLLGYRWPAEQDAEMELAEQQREWARRCESLFTWADEDGIVCIPSVRGELPAWERLLRLLAAAFGEAWNDSVRRKILAEAGSSTLDGWLRNRFFDQHCKLFRQRPFIWHLWDGRRRDGFPCTG